MNTTEVVPHDKERYSSFQHRELLTDGVGLSRKAPNVHSYAQIRPFDVGSRDVFPIRISSFDVRYGSNNSSATVPLWACLGTPVNLPQLRVMHVTAVPFFDCSDVASQSVTGDLVNPKRSLAQIVNELVRADRVSRPNVVREN